VGRGRTVTGDNVTFLGADQRVWRPMLVNQKIFGDESILVTVQFAESRRPFLRSRTSRLFAFITTATKFNYEFVEPWPLVSRSVSQSATDEEFASCCRQFLADLDRLDNESAELGISSWGDLLDVFGEESQKLLVDLFDRFTDARFRLTSVLSKIELPIDAGLRTDAVSEMNQFIARCAPASIGALSLALQEFAVDVERLKKRAGAAGDSSDYPDKAGAPH
jgi:hypothetical protein